MRSLLILPHIKVECANAISGLTYGFPAVTHFLGYVHALSRKLAAELKTKRRLDLNGCAIICHHHQIHTYEAGWDQCFSLTRNPLDEKGKTPSFNEEGRIHMEVSLIIGCGFASDQLDFGTDDSDEDVKEFEKLIGRLAVGMRLAGGYITGMSPAEFKLLPSHYEHNEHNTFGRKILRKLLPGFILRDRSPLLQGGLSEGKAASSLDLLLDFYTFKSRALPTQNQEGEKREKVKWERVAKPCSGWIVPLQVGYRAISQLYDPNEVSGSRDAQTPFRFVEPVYGLGEWLGVHRIADLDSVIWRYRHDDEYYLCSNNNNKNLEEQI